MFGSMGCRPRARSLLHCHGVLALRDRSLSEALLAVLEGTPEICIHVHVYVCVYVYMRIYVCMYVCMCIYIDMCVCVCVYVYICVCMYIIIYIRTYLFIYLLR